MKLNLSIKRIGALLMLLVFTITIIPKIYFHDALSHHQDELFTNTSDEQLATQHYNCGFVSVMAITPFITSASPGVWSKLRAFDIFNNDIPTFYERMSALHLTLRGPPIA